MFGPLTFIIIEILFITIITTAILRLFAGSADEDDAARVRKTIINGAYPILVQIAMVFNSNLFCVVIVYEREHMIRYLLNFQGITSPAYILGMTLAENLILMIPNILVIVFGLLFQIDVITDNAFLFLVTLIVFGFAFIPLVNLFAQPWNKVESAFKYVVAEIAVFWIAGAILAAATELQD